MEAEISGDGIVFTDTQEKQVQYTIAE